MSKIIGNKKWFQMSSMSKAVVFASLCIFALCIAVFASPQDVPDSQKSPMVGDWDLKTVNGYSSEGEYINSPDRLCMMRYDGKPVTADSLNIKVKSVQGKLIHAEIMETPVCGEYDNGVIYIEYDTVMFHVYYQGYVDGNKIYGKFLYHQNIQFMPGVNPAYSFYCEHYKDKTNIRCETESNKVRTMSEIEGVVFNANSAKAFVGKEIIDLDPNKEQKMSIVRVSGDNFYGYLHQVIYDPETKKDSTVKVNMAGTVYRYYGDDIVALAMDDTGKFWVVSVYSGKVVRMQSTAMDDTSNTYGKGASVVRTYSKDAADVSLIPDVKNFARTKWASGKGYTIDSAGKMYEMNWGATLFILKQSDTLVHMRFMLLNMLGGNVYGFVTNFEKFTEIDVFFVDDYGVQYVAYLKPTNDPNKMVFVCTFIDRDIDARAFYIEFFKMESSQESL